MGESRQETVRRSEGGNGIDLVWAREEKSARMAVPNFI
jgi:hypothetical protein